MLALIIALLPVRGYTNEIYILSAPPWVAWETGASIFNPIAFHLSQESGKQVIYKHPPNWASYINQMRDSEYDIVFDDPHLVSWRAKKLKHIPIVKLDYVPGFAIITQENNENIVQLSDLAGKLVCAKAPPSLAATILYTQFSNPVRQPQIVAAAEDTDAIRKLLGDDCQGAVLSLRDHRQLNPDQIANTRILFISEDLPPQAFTVDPRIPNDIREIFKSALLSPAGQQASAKLLRLFADSNGMLPANRAEYENGFDLLRYHWAMD